MRMVMRDAPAASAPSTARRGVTPAAPPPHPALRGPGDSGESFWFCIRPECQQLQY